MGIKDVVELLSSVGFSTPPAWLRPFHALSNGEQFRVNLARTLAESPELAVVDEFTSVVDRQVAQVGSRRDRQGRPAPRARSSSPYRATTTSSTGSIPTGSSSPTSAAANGGLFKDGPRSRWKSIRSHRSVWNLFKSHHYLSSSIHPASRCFVGLINGQPVAFESYLHFPHPHVSDIKIGHRLVVMPDYQGLGIGCKFEEWLGEHLAAQGYPVSQRHGPPRPDRLLPAKPALATDQPRRRLQGRLQPQGRRQAGSTEAPVPQAGQGPPHGHLSPSSTSRSAESHASLKTFVGAKIHGIRITDKSLNYRGSATIPVEPDGSGRDPRPTSGSTWSTSPTATAGTPTPSRARRGNSP